MSGVKVVGLSNESGEQEVQQNEEEAQQPEEQEQELEPDLILEKSKGFSSLRTKPVAEEHPTNEETQEIKQEEEEAPKKETKQPKVLDKKVKCKKCNKEMTLKTYRYSHEKNCQGTLESKPVKPQAKPKAKQQLQQRLITKPVAERPLPPEPVIERNPVFDVRQHYQALQNEYIKQKQDKYNNLCQSMFNSKTKKRW